jgi:dienelactone hydrolase
MSTTIKFSSHGSSISPEVFGSVSGAKGGIVVIAYGSDGMTDNLNGPWASMIRDYAEKLSSQGHPAIIRDYFARTGTEPGLGALEDIPVHLDEWQATILDGMTFATTLPGVDPSRMGILGFSFGGHICLKNRDHAKVLIEFFAPELAGVGSVATGPKNAQVHHGLADQVVPFANANNIEGILASEGVATELFSYEEAGHGFLGDDPKNTSARLNSQERTLSCFARFL